MNVDYDPDCFLDTNILIYAFDRSAGKKHDIAAKIIRDCWKNETGRISIQVLQEFFVNITHKITTPLDHRTARQVVADFAQWLVHSPKVSDLVEALDLQDRFQISFWDAMIIQSATRLGCKQLLTEDLHHGQLYGDVQAINPFMDLD